jgi:KUP system potassium uptake protein
MSEHAHNSGLKKLTAAGLIITLGIIYGDIGTSPLYVMKAIVGDRIISRELILGGISCIFWTLTIQTTVKYIILTLRADNKGEGGIFSLYALVKRTKIGWLLFPAIIGGAALLGEGIITPAISVSAAVEGLKEKYPINTLPIILGVLFLLFAIQQFGTKSIGKFFGPVMLVWFLMLFSLGVSQIVTDFSVLAAVSPTYAYNLLVEYPKGFWILGAVFLCTTGAEALYSDLGHCGKLNIRASWMFVKTSLLLNYFGQAAWLLKSEGNLLEGVNPFYEIIPEWFFIPGFIIAMVATIVASQALISGSFTLINEAIRLNLWPKVRISYPTDLKGQLYIPSINWLLFIGCAGIVLYFEESSAMESAYGMTIIIGMMMSSILLVFYMGMKRYNRIIINLFIFVYLSVESSFMIANLEKIPEGGWISLLIATVIALIMWIWYDARKIRNRYVEFVKLDEYLELLCDLKTDLSVPKYATHLVFLTSANYEEEVESKIIYSILQRQPKRADIYWFLHVDVVDEPYRMDYRVNEIVNDTVIRVDFYLGFRVAPRINLMFRKVVQDLVKCKEVDIVSRYESLNKNQVIGDFRFIVLEKFLSNENDIPFYEKIVLDIYFMLKSVSLSEEKAFGLDTSSVHIEKVPLVISPIREINLKRLPSPNHS